MTINEEPQNSEAVAARRSVEVFADEHLANMETPEHIANERMEAAKEKFGALTGSMAKGFSRVAKGLGYAIKVGVFAPDVLAIEAGEAVAATAKRGMKAATETVEKGARATTEAAQYGYYTAKFRTGEAAKAIGDLAWKSGGRAVTEFGHDLGEAARVMATGESWRTLGGAALKKAQDFGAGVKYIAAELPEDEINKFCIARTGETGGDLWNKGKDAVSQVLGEVKETANSKYDAAAEWTTLKAAEKVFDARMSYLRMEQRVSDARGWARTRVRKWQEQRATEKVEAALRNLEARKAALAKLQERFSAGSNA